MQDISNNEAWFKRNEIYPNIFSPKFPLKLLLENRILGPLIQNKFGGNFGLMKYGAKFRNVGTTLEQYKIFCDSQILTNLYVCVRHLLLEAKALW